MEHQPQSADLNAKLTTHRSENKIRVTEITFEKLCHLISLVKVQLDKRTENAKRYPDEIKHHHRIRFKQPVVQKGRHSMDQQVRIRSERKVRAVLPGLQALSVDQIVQWLPVVERFITVRNVRPECSTNAGAQKRLKCDIDIGVDRIGFGSRKRSTSAKKN